MKLLKLEFYKCRRRKILLICAAALGMELLWMGVYFARMEPEEMTEGWMLLLYNLSMVDSIILPLGIATLASRNCELEHKGNTWKLLETMTSPGGLYAAKICWGALILGGLLLISFPDPFLGHSWDFSPSCPGGYPLCSILFNRGYPFTLPTRQYP